MKNIVVVSLSALVVGLSGFLIYDNSHHRKSAAEVKTEFNDLKNDYKFIRKDLENTINKLQISNQVVLEQKQTIENLLKKNEITEQELSIAKKIMKNISNSVLETYQKEVAHLELEKKKLNEERLLNKKQIIDLKSKLHTLENSQHTLRKKYNQEKKESEKKTELLTYAPGISLSNFKLKGVKVRSSGREVETDRASRVNRLKVSFNINANPLAEKGIKDLYIVVTSPNKLPQIFDNKPTGTFTSNGKLQTYSDKISIHYNQEESIPIELEWNYSDFKKGEYIIEVYQNTGEKKFVKVGGTIKKLD